MYFSVNAGKVLQELPQMALLWHATDGPCCRSCHTWPYCGMQQMARVAGAATDGPLVWDVTDGPIVGVATLPVWVNKRGPATIVAAPRAWSSVGGHGRLITPIKFYDQRQLPLGYCEKRVVS